MKPAEKQKRDNPAMQAVKAEDPQPQVHPRVAQAAGDAVQAFIREKKQFFAQEQHYLGEMEQGLKRMQEDLIARRGAQARLQQVIAELETIANGKEELQAAAAGGGPAGTAAAAAERAEGK